MSAENKTSVETASDSPVAHRRMVSVREGIKTSLLLCVWLMLVWPVILTMIFLWFVSKVMAMLDTIITRRRSDLGHNSLKDCVKFAVSGEFMERR